MSTRPEWFRHGAVVHAFDAGRPRSLCRNLDRPGGRPDTRGWAVLTGRGVCRICRYMLERRLGIGAKAAT